MADHQFDTDLERLFGQAPVLADSEAFARRVEARLDKSWRWRTLGLGVAGVAGGLIAATQTFNAGFDLRLREASTASTHAVETAYRQAAAVGAEGLLPASMDVGLFWAASAVIVVVALIGATRVFDEI